MNKPIMVLAYLLAIAIAFSAGQAAAQEKAKGKAPQGKPLPVVAVRKAEVAPLSRTLELTGSATPTRQARLASPGEGPIQNCRVREGAQVKRGERLVTIGRSGAAAAQVTAASESVKEQQAELNRIKILVQSGAVPGSQLDTARAKYEGARALLAKARELAGDYSVSAPWDGVVSKVLVKDGDFVAPRTPLVEMYDPASLVIRLAVPEAQATEVFKGTPATVQLDAYPGKTFAGKISLVYPDLDTRMRTRTAEVKLDAPVALIPGMFARLKLTLQTAAEAVAVPSDAVLVLPNGEKVAYILKDGKAQRRVVKTGLETGGKVQIISGIQPGETMVTAGNEKLKDGMAVKVQGGAGK
ncbi:MAG: efflux RND transporter periplasmic adaptor subunit [Syntrophales bacterium]|nr:efflux RND transporter periplasmic adaptor subunit [Syntrophales bacterium]MDD5641346.1 efflux RND transporter periplasmic adaptor subunit [Syntrophales bacterium]